MKTVIFRRDFRGVNTREQFYERGQTVTLPDDAAAGLLAEGAVALVEPPVPTPPVSAPVENDPAAGDTPAVETSEAPAEVKPAAKRAGKKAAKK